MPTDPAAAVRAIVEALNAGRTETAWDAARDLLAEGPDDASLNQLAATAALRTGRHEDARDLARRSLLRRPGHVATLILLGRAARALEDHASAVEALTRAAEVASDRAEAVFLLYAARVEAGEAEAELDLGDLEARFPHEASRWEDLAQTLLARGRREAALACLSIAARRTPTFAVAMRRGLLCKDLGRLAEARQAFTEATMLEPRSARAWFLLGVAAQDGRDDEAAETAYCRALALDPSLPEAAVNLGTVLQRAGDLDGAKAAYAQAVGMRPDTFGRVAQAMTASPKGELWLDLSALRRSLGG